jgi:hypothetical protein
VRWLHAPGGQGKTRLATQFAQDSAGEGWKVVTAVSGVGNVIAPPGSQDLRLDGARGLLLIVDYADRWPLAHLTWLLSNALLHHTGIPARVLLLARTAHAWPALHAALTDHQANMSQRVLTPLMARTGGPMRMFIAARDAFAAHYGIADSRVIDPPGSMDDAAMGLTLGVHVAALVAVDAHARGAQPPADPDGLTRYLLDREQVHWTRMFENRCKGLDYETPPETMTRTVFTATLTGALDYATGKNVLATLDLAAPSLSSDRVLADHGRCYPPTSPAPDAVLEPLGPDRLAEDFLALMLPGRPHGQPHQPWAGSTATTLLTADPRPP